MIQLSSDHWAGAPDSITSHIGGLSRGANIYLMIDKPFRGNPRFSAAFGIGVGTSHIFFKKMFVDISSVNARLPFTAADSLQHFKKFKVATSFLEIPLELRFTSDPGNSNKAIKAAHGIKLGTLLNAHIKGKTLQDASGKTIIAYTQKQSTKSYFNASRIAVTGRIGYGIFSLLGAYNLTTLFKDGVAADMKLYQIGFTISGL